MLPSSEQIQFTQQKEHLDVDGADNQQCEHAAVIAYMWKA